MKPTKHDNDKKAKPDAITTQGGATPLWIACRTLMAGHEKEFFSQWKKVAKTFQEDDVHDLRVASRRMREALALFSPYLPANKSARIEKQVKKVTKMLGDLRNTDEACLFFSELAPEELAQSHHEVEELLSGLRVEREQAHKKLEKELSSLNPKPLRGEFRCVRNRPNLFRSNSVDPSTSIAVFAGGAIMQRAETLNELLPRAIHEADTEAQHELRIAFKRMRYRLEIIAPLLRGGYHELHSELKGYQDVLGKLHDIDVFAEMVRDRLADGAGKQELLQVMADRRSRLHSSFLERLTSFPIDSIGERARDAL